MSSDWLTISHRQQYLHDHIARCTCCGAWEIITEIELNMRAAELMPPATDCEHLNPNLNREAAS
jgi:hypothetical protein